MLGNRKLILDTFCEVYDLLKPWADDHFWDLNSHKMQSNSVYVIGRKQMHTHIDLIKQHCQDNSVKIVFSNPHEGSSTMLGQCVQLGIMDLVRHGRIQLISGGVLELPCLLYDSFLPKILDYEQNLTAIEQYKSNWSEHRPYQFLFLNGRYRTHRKQLLQDLESVLPQALWTNLDSQSGPINLLPKDYEFDFYQNTTVSTGFVKAELFRGEWGEIYLKSAPYSDTHFSLVTETVFEYPYSFRTEKIWKPIAMGHPFIAVANSGFYQDLHQLGFQTFSSVIDESFDQIEDNQSRLEKIAQIVKDLCRQDLAGFSKECYNVCKYNQEHLAHLRSQVRKEFPERFFQYINE